MLRALCFAAVAAVGSGLVAPRILPGQRAGALAAAPQFFGIPASFAGIGGGESRKSLKAELLELCDAVKAGSAETPAQRERIVALIEQLEAVNPTPKALSRPELLSKEWKLRWTTSDGILGRDRALFKPVVDTIYQLIDASELSARNREVTKLVAGKVDVPRSVTAKLTPLNDNKVRVDFQEFCVGPLKIKAPPSATGALEFTYLDDDLRISRGDKKNLFVLTA